MRFRTTCPVPTAILALAVLLAAASPASADDAPPDLSGAWVLNVQASDDPAAVMSQARGNGGGKGGGIGGGGTGGGGGGRRGGRPAAPGGGSDGAPESGEDAPDRAAAAGMQRRIQRLEILTAGDEFNITDGLDISRLLHTDGREETVWTERGEARATARWEGRALQVVWAGGPGPERTTRYELAPDGEQLVVLDQIARPGGKAPVTIRLVYDRRPQAAR